MTRREACERLGVWECCDTALPQPWLDALVEKTGVEYDAALCSLVWVYDEHALLWGRPFALTEEGNRILALANERMSTAFLLTETPIRDAEAEG